MLIKGSKDVKEALKKDLLSNILHISKNNMEENKKFFDNQPYNEYINLNNFNNQISLGDYTLSTTERTRITKEEISKELTIDKNNSESNFFKRQQRKNYDNIFLNHLIFNQMNIKQIRNYIYFIQKIFNKKYGKYLKNIIINREQDNFCNDNFTKEIYHLESIIARYSIIIFFLVKNQQINMAKNIFLLMIKENIIFINFFEKNLFREYSHIENNIKLIQHGCPKSILTLSKIYSIILKYSLLFNMAKNRNIFLSRYLALQKLNYNIFFLKNEVRGSYLISDIAIKYFYANCLFNASYFSIMFYSGMSIPIKLSELIFKLYDGMNEFLFEKKEKSLILKTSFNYALFIYLSGNNDLALTQLDSIKEKLISFYDYSDDEEDGEDRFESHHKDKDDYDPFNGLKQKKEMADKLIANMKEKLFIKRQETMKKMERKRGLSKSQNTIDKIKEILFNRRESNIYLNTKNIFDPFNKTQINYFHNNNQKKNIKIEDIKKFFISDVKTVLNKKNRKCSITDRDISNKLKFQNYFGVHSNNTNSCSQSIVDLRTSHINFRSILKINKLNIPKYMTDSLLVETELLMCEIELDSKNIDKAYQHFKNSILVLFISKQNDEQNDIKSQRDFRKKLRIISVYLKEINKFIDEKNSKKHKFQIIKNPVKTTKTFLSLNKKKIFKDKKISFKKSSLRLGKNYLLESIDANINEETNPSYKGNEYYNKLLNEKLSKEIEKFFLFLISLSVYQIKLLNDTQPKREIRNDLPILFNWQFKDSLSSEQRNNLNNLHTTSITRNMILSSPDKLILPTNLNFSVLNYNEILGKDFINKNINNKLNRSKVKNHKYEKIISLSNSIEYDYFKKIIFSKKIGKKIQKFLLDNYSLVMKILKELNLNEINDIIKNPDILVSPINNYKKQKSKILNKNWYNNNYLLKNKKIKDLKKLIFKLNNYKENEKKEYCTDIIMDSDENYGSINLSINNTSFFDDEND